MSTNRLGATLLVMICLLLPRISFADQTLQSPLLVTTTGQPAFVSVDFSEERKVQLGLKELGFYSGIIDGKLSDATKEAIRKYQQSEQLAGTGIISAEFKLAFNANKRAIGAIRAYFKSKGCEPVNELVLKCPAGDLLFQGF